MIDKVVPSLEAALQGVRDGATVMIGGFGGAGQPNELIDALIAQGARDLVIVNNNAGNGETISFQAGLTGTITLTSGELSINKGLMIQGPGEKLLTISGNNASRVFNIAMVNFDVTLSGLTIANGKAAGSAARGGAILSDNDGTFISGTLNLINCTLSGNSASASGDSSGNSANGGAIYTYFGAVNVMGSTFSGNSATANGPAEYVSASGGSIYANVGAITIIGSTFSGNSATATGPGTSTSVLGGSIFAGAGDLTITGSKLLNNSASASGATNNQTVQGGVIFNNIGVLTVTNSALAGNSATASGNGYCSVSGGAFFVNSSGLVSVTNSTISNNSARANGNGSNSNSNSSVGGGIYIRSAPAKITGSTISGNLVVVNSLGSTDGFGRGGGIFHSSGVLGLTNSTVSGNSVTASDGAHNTSAGGGIWKGGTVVVLTSSTVLGNSISSSGGGTNYSEGGGIWQNGGMVAARNSIIAQNSSTGSSPDLNETGTSFGYNFIGNGSSSSFTNGVNNDQVGTTGAELDPKLGPLISNGGLTQTHRQLAGSPVIKKDGKIKAGHVIEKIDGTAITADVDPAKLLNRKAGKPTLLSIYDPKTKTFILGVKAKTRSVLPRSPPRPSSAM